MSTKLSPLSPQISEGDDQIQVCLCPSAACAAMGGARVTLFNPKVKMSWGKFKELSVTSATSGPTVTFTGGNVCRGVCVWVCVGGVWVWGVWGVCVWGGGGGCGGCVCVGGCGVCVCGGVGVGVWGVCVWGGVGCVCVGGWGWVCGVCVCGGVGVGVCVGGWGWVCVWGGGGGCGCVYWWVGGCGCMHVCVCTYVHAYVQCMCTCV